VQVGLWAVFGVVVAAIVAAYVFFVSAGHGWDWPPQTHYYGLLADGFLSGRLHLGISPSPELLAKANPHDFANRDLWFWDATLYKGQYYLYWGPVPGVIAAAIQLVLPGGAQVADGHLVLLFVVGRLVIGAALVVLCWRWLFPTLHPVAVAGALLVFGLANPYPYTLGRPGVYEVAIEGGQFFLLAGVLALFVALGRPGTRRRELALSAVAASAWGAALGCRISLVLAVGALVVATAVLSSLNVGRVLRESVMRLAVLAAPVALSLFLLGAYNYARFDAWTEFGTNYQLDNLQYSFGFSRFAPNLHAYSLRRFLVSCRFPFVNAPFGAIQLMPAWFNPATTGYFPLEPAVGILIAAPCVLFGAVAIGGAGKLLWSREWRTTGFTPRERVYVWWVVTCAVIVLLAGVPTWGMPLSTMRYLADFTSAALLLAVLGFCTLAARNASWPRRTVHVLGGALAAYTVGIGLLFGFTGGYYSSFERHNPALNEQLVRRLSMCN
jgi:hypothetical protein